MGFTPEKAKTAINKFFVLTTFLCFVTTIKTHFSGNNTIKPELYIFI